MMTRILRCAAIAALCGLAAQPAAAQKTGWPTKPVRFIVPFPPGGTVDPLARLVGSKLTPVLGQQFIVDNRTGASGTLGTGIAAKAVPDGYTFVFVFDMHPVNPFLIPNLPFDTVKDFAPVMLVATAPYAIVTNAAKPYRSFTDVIKTAKAKPATVTFGSVGSGSLGHLMMTLVQQAGGFKIVHVPYKGGGPMTVDALGGNIDLAVGTVALLTPHVKGGKLRAVATTGSQRSTALPDVPTVAEQGFPGFSVLAWWGILTTAGTPKPVIDRFHAELVKVFDQPDVRKQLGETLGMDLIVSSPAHLQKFVLSEMARWGKVVKEHGISGE
jgi:tripartite-type tricarboxylate transporter receptor subunit TctC